MDPVTFLIPETGVILILSCTDPDKLAGRAGLPGGMFEGVFDRGIMAMLSSSARLAGFRGDEMTGRALFQSRFRYAALRSSTCSRLRRFFMKYAADPAMAKAARIPKTMRTMLVVPMPFLIEGGASVVVGEVETPGVVAVDELEVGFGVAEFVKGEVLAAGLVVEVVDVGDGL